MMTFFGLGVRCCTVAMVDGVALGLVLYSGMLRATPSVTGTRTPVLVIDVKPPCTGQAELRAML